MGKGCAAPAQFADASALSPKTACLQLPILYVALESEASALPESLTLSLTSPM